MARKPKTRRAGFKCWMPHITHFKDVSHGTWRESQAKQDKHCRKNKINIERQLAKFKAFGLLKIDEPFGRVYTYDFKGF